jgi:hypothetical protein
MQNLLAQAASQAGDQQKQLLEQLRDVHAPESVNWWPLALGWWIIIALVAIIIILLVVKAYLKKRHYRFARFAIKELEAIKADSHDKRWLAKSHHVMRRLSLCYLPEEEVGRMNQQQWASFLQATSDQKLSDDTLDAFVDLPYKPESYSESLNKASMMDDIMQWAANFPEQAKQWQKATNVKPGETNV